MGDVNNREIEGVGAVVDKAAGAAKGGSKKMKVDGEIMDKGERGREREREGSECLASGESDPCPPTTDGRVWEMGGSAAEGGWKGRREDKQTDGAKSRSPPSLLIQLLNRYYYS